MSCVESIQGDCKLDTVKIFFKLIGTAKEVVRVIVAIESEPNADDFDALLSMIEKMYEDASTKGQMYCIIFYLYEGAQLNLMQIVRTVTLLQKNRHLTQKYILTSCIVGSSSMTKFIEMLFSLYKPVGHVELTNDLNHAKDHCFERAERYAGEER